MRAAEVCSVPISAAGSWAEAKRMGLWRGHWVSCGCQLQGWVTWHPGWGGGNNMAAFKLLSLPEVQSKGSSGSMDGGWSVAALSDGSNLGAAQWVQEAAPQPGCLL